MANNYHIGNIVRLTASFTDTGGSFKDPTMVTFTYGDPTGNWSTELMGGGEVTHPSTGVYVLDITVDEAGAWPYKVNSTGVVTTAGESYFRVKHARTST